MKKILILIVLLLMVYPLVISAAEWKQAPQRLQQIGNTLIIENPNK